MLWTIFNAGFWSPEVDLRVVYNSVNILARVKSGDTQGVWKLVSLLCSTIFPLRCVK